jgi:hypothetical protein
MRNRRVLHDIVQDFEDPTIYPSGGSNSGVSKTMLEAGSDSRDVDASLTYSSTDPEIYKTFGTLLLKDANDIDLAEWMIYTKMTVILVARFWPNRGVNLRATVYETLPEREPPEVEVLVQEPCKKNPMRIDHGDSDQPRPNRGLDQGCQPRTCVQLPTGRDSRDVRKGSGRHDVAAARRPVLETLQPSTKLDDTHEGDH